MKDTVEIIKTLLIEIETLKKQLQDEYEYHEDVCDRYKKQIYELELKLNK